MQKAATLLMNSNKLDVTSGLTRLNHIASGHPLGPVKIRLKSKTSNATSFFGERKCALRETGGVSIDIRVSKLDGMDFSSVNGLSCITSENQLVSMLL